MNPSFFEPGELVRLLDAARAQVSHTVPGASRGELQKAIEKIEAHLRNQSGRHITNTGRRWRRSRPYPV